MRKVLLEQIAEITTMQPGTMAEEWRERPDPSGEGIVRHGPYYKYQVWQDGRNISRRVPVSEAAQLREDIDNAQRYKQLTDELAQLNIEYTLALRASEAKTGDNVECKKTPYRSEEGKIYRNRRLHRQSQRKTKCK